MDEQKTFWRKYEILIVVLITLLFIYSFVFFNQKINFFLGNDLIVYLTASRSSLNLVYGQTVPVEFSVSTDNVAYCKAECLYSFTDRSRNEVLDKNSFEIQKNDQFAKSYNLSVKRLGSGQDIYSFEVSCKSLRSFFCLTSSPVKLRTSTVAVSYDLTETDKELKRALKQNVSEVLRLLYDVDVVHQMVSQKFFQLGFKANLLNLSRQKIGIDDAYDKNKLSIENLRNLWSEENYAQLSRLFSSSYQKNLSEIKYSLEELNSSIDNIVNYHNEMLAGLSILSDKAISFHLYSEIMNNENLKKSIESYFEDLKKINSSLETNNFENYSYVAKNISALDSRQKAIAEIIRLPSSAIVFKIEHYSRLGNDLLCSIMQDCKNNDSDNFSISSPVKNTWQFMNSYPSILPLNKSCEALWELNQTYSRAREEAKALIKANGIILDDESIKSAADIMQNEIRKINNSYLDSLRNLILENKTAAETLEIAVSILPQKMARLDSNASYANQSINMSSYLLSNISIPYESLSLLEECGHLSKPRKFEKFSPEFIEKNITYNIVQNIGTSLSDNPPICCVFNECRPCCSDDSCRNDPKTFPIILLHGHSFVSDNSPEFSLDSFNKLQSRLQEDGYLNVGTISLYSKNEPFEPGVWGMSGRPVTIKASYYYDAFRKDDKYIVVPTKSENIDTYSIRLKAIIDMVKERTGKPKVNIIAHSMGGLVARRYMQIFTADINKLVLIATPNKGVSGAARDYCGLIGESRECQDMNENSLFINKLNDPLKQPLNVRLYTIAGQGCLMEEGNGDGIITMENAKLQNAKNYYVNGTCEGLFGENLHTEILNIDAYPETYNAVKEILKEQE
ncbi:alpha/beta fold hydrolase [Candidatus Woesearchaeota archaeon]|nr:alpha/beta fold hydrolase [Candidatus Woesearchaeota archaeon]